MSNHGADRVQDDPASQLGGIFVHVIRRGYLHDFHPAESLGSNRMDHFECFAREKAARLGRSGAGCESWVDRVDVKRKIDGLASFPSHLQRDLGSLFWPEILDIVHGHDTGPAPTGDSSAGPVAIPATDSNLNQVFGMAVRQADIVHVTVVAMRMCRPLVGRPEPRGGMHALVHVLFLDVDMPVDMDDAHIPINVGRYSADIGEAEAVIATADDRKYTGRIDVGDRFRDLTERLFDVPGNNENVPGIAEVEFLVEVDPSVKPVTVIECGNSADCLRTKPRARPVCRR